MPSSYHYRAVLYMGGRHLEDAAFDPVNDQIAFGGEFASDHRGDVVGWEVGILGAGWNKDTPDGRAETTTTEVYAGLHKDFVLAAFQPYFGGGASLINASVDTMSGSDSDTSVAAYAHAGLIYNATDGAFVGVDFRAMFGTAMSLNDADSDADYRQVALVVGFRF